MNSNLKPVAAFAAFVTFGIIPPVVALHLSKPRLAEAHASYAATAADAAAGHDFAMANAAP